MGGGRGVVWEEEGVWCGRQRTLVKNVSLMVSSPLGSFKLGPSSGLGMKLHMEEERRLQMRKGEGEEGGEEGRRGGGKEGRRGGGEEGRREGGEEGRRGGGKEGRRGGGEEGRRRGGESTYRG